MGRITVFVIAVASILGGVVLAASTGEKSDASPKHVATAKKLVEFEGATLRPADAKKAKANGYHRYYSDWYTHNAHDLKREIDILNLLNGLYLSDVQMRHMMVLATKAERDRRSIGYQVGALNTGLERALMNVKKKLLAGHTLDASACAPTPEVAAIQADIDRLRGGMNKRLVRYEAYAKAVLTASQREKVYNYQHCLIPVKNMKDPTRIGQADSGSRNEKILEGIKNMSDAQFVARKPQLIEDHIHYMEKYMGKLSDEEREVEVKRLTVVFAKARRMDDLDFQFEKAKLAAELRSDYSEVKERLKDVGHQLAKVMSESSGPEGNHVGVIGSMLLDPHIIPILGKRLKIYEGFEESEPVDLDKIEGVAACLNGSCAID